MYYKNMGCLRYKVIIIVIIIVIVIIIIIIIIVVFLLIFSFRLIVQNFVIIYLFIVR